MTTYRNSLLEIFGINHEYAAIMSSTILLQRENDVEPFGEIVTDKKGKTVLRIGQVISTGPVLRVR